METYKINHELNQYDYVEGIEFNGLMPETMKLTDTTGKSDENVKFFGANAKGSDSLEVIDIDAIMESDSSEGGKNGGEGEGN